MQITIDTGTATTQELVALRAFITSMLGDDAPPLAQYADRPAAASDAPIAEPLNPSVAFATPASMPSPAPSGSGPLAPPPNDGSQPPFEGLDEGDGFITTHIDGQPVSTAPPSVDIHGLPWDARIHASTKSLNKDGSWRGKKGLPDGLTASVTAELRAAGWTAPLPPPVPDVPPPPMPYVQSAPAAPPPPPTPQAAAMAAVVAETVAPPASPNQPFLETMQRVTAMQSAGTCTPLDVTNICAQMGLTGMRDLLGRPDLVPTFNAALDALTQ